MKLFWKIETKKDIVVYGEQGIEKLCQFPNLYSQMMSRNGIPRLSIGDGFRGVFNHFVCVTSHGWCLASQVLGIIQLTIPSWCPQLYQGGGVWLRYNDRLFVVSFLHRFTPQDLKELKKLLKKDLLISQKRGDHCVIHLISQHGLLDQSRGELSDQKEKALLKFKDYLNMHPGWDIVL